MKNPTPTQNKNALLVYYEDGTIITAGLSRGQVLQVAKLIERAVLDQPFAQPAPPSVPEPAPEPT